MKIIESYILSNFKRISELPELPNNVPIKGERLQYSFPRKYLNLFLTMVLDRAFLFFFFFFFFFFFNYALWNQTKLKVHSSSEVLLVYSTTSWRLVILTIEAEVRVTSQQPSRHTGAHKSQDQEVRSQLFCTSLNCLALKEGTPHLTGLDRDPFESRSLCQTPSSGNKLTLGCPKPTGQKVVTLESASCISLP